MTDSEKIHTAMVKALDDAAWAHYPEMPNGDDLVAAFFAELDRHGYAVVPKEPTPEMISDGMFAAYPDTPGPIPGTWRAMIAAAPKFL